MNAREAAIEAARKKMRRIYPDVSTDEIGQLFDAARSVDAITFADEWEQVGIRTILGTRRAVFVRRPVEE